eukprot:m.221479 g.221479  ORF g.221479 m.221479 type:complete len:439 (+) comp10595_c0_seq1:326-1642(+)
MQPMRIHGVWYDVTKFSHPGGPVMLSLGEGRDATALFEGHHPFTNRAMLEKLLAKYRLKDQSGAHTLDARDETVPFVWPEFESKSTESPAEPPVSAFARELRQKVQAYFQAEAERRGVPFLEATKATPRRWIEMIIFTLLFAFTLPAFFRGELWTLLATPLIYWVFGVNLFHDASHSALSRNWRLNVLGTYVGWWFSSPLEWYHQHIIGHHAYPNIPERDPDLYHNAKMERHTKTLRWRPLHQHQASTWVPIWMIGTFAMNFVKPLQMFGSNMYNRCVAMMPIGRERSIQHFLGRVLIFCLCHVWPFFTFPLWKALLFALVPVMIVSVCFMTSTQINHLTPENVDVESDDYYKHQVLTSHAFATTSWMVYYFTGGLNFQIEHHLFPTVNHCHLRYLQPMVKQICAKHNVFYHETPTLMQALGKYVQHLKELAAKPAAE